MTELLSQSPKAGQTVSVEKEQRDVRLYFAARSVALFLIPVLCYVLLTEKGSFFAVFIGILAASWPFLCLFARFRGKMTLFRISLCVGLLLSISFGRILAVRIRGTDFAAKLAAAASTQEHTFTGQIDRAEVSSLQNMYIRLTHMDGKPLKMPLLTLAENSSGHYLPQYAVLTFTARFRLLENRTDFSDRDGGFDRAAYGKSKGVYGEIYDVENMQLTGESSLNRFGRKAVCDILFAGPHAALRIVRSKQAFTEAGALLNGLLYGDKGDFSKSDKENFALSGLTHILCVSGLHFSLVFGMFGLFIGQIVRQRGCRIFLLFLLSIGYLYICGFTPSAMRAAFLSYTTLFGFARPKGRRLAENLLIAVGAICFLKPEVIFDIGFHLSVLSCLGITLSLQLCRLLESLLSNSLVWALVSAVILSVSAYGFTFFYSQSVFGSLGLGNIPASCLGVFPAQIYLVCAWISVFLVPLFPACAEVFGSIFMLLTRVIMAIAAYFADFPRLEPIVIGKLSPYSYFFGFYFLALIAARNRIRGLKLWFAVMGLVLVAVSAEGLSLLL